VQTSETHVNSRKDSLQVFQMARGLCANMTPRARAGAFPCSWAGSGWFQPVTIHSFSFSFSVRLSKFIENSGKMVKI
jgi:hypothetical protein